MRLDRLPVGEAIIGFLALALIATFVLARQEIGSPEGAGADDASASSSAAASGSTVPGGLEIIMTDNKFDPTELTAAAGATVTINIKNEGAAVHNVHIAGANGQYAAAFCTTGGADPCSDPNRVGGGGTATLTFTVPNAPGEEIPYRCDYHTTEMKGTLTVE